MRKLTITVAAKDYTISLDEDFANFLESDLKEFLNSNDTLDSKNLLTAYVQKCYEVYNQTQDVTKLILKISKELND